MPTQNGTFKYGIQFKVNQASLNSITKSLEKIQQAASKNKDKGLQTQFNQAAEAAQKLQSIINSSWNDKLQQLNLNTFNKGLKDASLDISTLQSKLGQAGAQGQAAFNQMAQAVLNTNVQVKQSKGLLDSMVESIGNAAKWGIASRVINTISSSIRSAFYYSKDLDRSLTNIRMVTGDSADEMQRFAKVANDTAKELGRSTLDYTEAAVGFYRQGLGDEDVAARTETTLKAQNITGTGSQMADYLTSVWNGFQVNAEHTEEVVDKLAKVADSSASDMSQLAIAMSKVAATANVLGVDVDQLTASIATVVATTRQAPESVGTAFKTIFARLNDIKAGADDAQISLGNYSEKMANLGFSVLDANGRLRNTGEVLNQIGSRWKELSKEQQVYLAQTMGGQRQITQVISLFDNWTTYLDLYNKSLESQGTLNQKNNIYLEETATVMKQLQAEAQRTYAALFDKDTVNGFTESITGVLKVFNNFIEGLGGGRQAFAYFATFVGSLFSKQIAQGILNAQAGIQRLMANIQSVVAKEKLLKSMTTSTERFNDVNGMSISGDALNKQVEYAQKLFLVQKGLTTEQQKQGTESQKQIGLLNDKIIKLTQEDKLRQQQVEKLKQETQLNVKYSWELDDVIKKEKEQAQNKSQQIRNFEKLLQIAREQTTQTGKAVDMSKAQIAARERIAVATKAQKEALREIYIQSQTTQFGDMTRDAAYTQFQRSWSKIISHIKEGSINFEEWEELIAILLNDTDALDQRLEKIDFIKKNINKTSEKERQQTEKQLRLQQKRVDTLAKIGKRRINVQNITKLTFAAGQAVTAWTGAIGTLRDTAATATEKAEAAWSGVQGTITAAGSMFGPLGMGIATIVNGLASMLGISEKIKKWFFSGEKAAEDLQKYNSKIKQVNQSLSKYNANISQLKGLQGEWESLSQKAGLYGQKVDQLTEEEQNRYYEIIDTFAQYNSNVIAGYDEQGRAIVRNNKALEDTIELLKRQKKEEIREKYGTAYQFYGKESENYENLQKDKDNKQSIFNEKKSDYKSKILYEGGNLNLENLREEDLIKLQNQGIKKEDIEKTIKELTDLSTEDIQNISIEHLNELGKTLTKIAEASNEAFNFSMLVPDFAEQKSEAEAAEYNYQIALQDYIQKTKLNTVGFLEATIKNGYKEQQEAYNSLLENMDENVADNLLLAFFDSWTVTEEGESELDKKIVSKNELSLVTEKARQYIDSLNNSYKSINSAFEKASKTLEFDPKTFQGTAKEYQEKLSETISETLGELKPQDYQTTEAQDVLKNLLKNLFNLSDIEINFDNDNLEMTGMTTSAQQAIEKAQDIIYQNLKETKTSKENRINVLQSLFSNQQISDFENIANEIDWNRIETLLIERGETLQQALDSELTRIRDKRQAVTSETINTFNDLIGKKIKGDVLDQDQVKAYDGIINKLLATYPQLKAQTDLLNQTWLEGTQEYSDALALVDRALDNLMYQNLDKQLNEAWSDLDWDKDHIGIDIDLDDSKILEFEDQITNFLKLDHQLNVSVHTDAQQEFNRLSESMEDIYAAAGKIGQNFVVSANDIRQLNNVFPGIIDGIQWVDQGYAQLNADVVQGAIATAQTQIATNQQQVVKQLKTQSQLLHFKSNTYQDMADAAKVLAGIQTETEMTSAEARQKISNGLTEIKVKDQQYAALQESAYQADVADAAKTEAAIFAQNWDQGSDLSTQAVVKFAQLGIQAQKELAKGPEGDINQVKRYTRIASGFKGASSVRTSAEDLTTVEKTTQDAIQNPNTSEKVWARLSEEYQKLADSTLKQATDIDGMIAQMGGRTREITLGFGNVAAGKGVSPKEEKQKKEKQEKAKDPEFIEYLQEEFDRYHDINIIIQRIGKSLQEVQAEQKKLFGKDLLDNLNKQVALLNQQIQAYEIKLSLAKQEQNELQASLKAQGVLFDSNTGAIANYASALQNKLNGVNAIIAHYNTMSAEQQQGYKDVVEAAKKDYQKFKQQIENYDKIIGETIPGLQKEIRNARDSIVEKQIAKFKMKVQIELDLAEATKQWNEFKKKVITRVHADDIIGNTEALMANYDAYYNQNGGSVQALSNQVNGTLAELNIIDSGGTSSVYGTDKAAAMKDLEEYSGKLMTALTDVQSLIDDVNKAFFDQIAAADKAFSRQSDHYEHLTNEIDHQQKLYTMLYGEEAYDDMVKFYETQQVNNNNELDFLRQQTEFWQAQVEASKNRLNNLEEGSKEWKEESKRLEELEDQWVDSLDQLNSKVEDSVQNLLDKYNNNVDRIFKDAESRLTNGKSLEYIGQEWQLINKETEDYLDSVNAIAQIQNFQDAAREAMNSSMGNLKNQKAIRDLMEEQVKLLKDKDKITKYDIDRANMLLQIEIKRQALEDARNNKSKLRLRRDTQGNYTYQYTADQDRNRQAQQEYRQAQVGLYNFDKEAYKENLNDVYSLQTEYFDKLKALYKKYPVWTEQAERERQLLTERYGTLINNKVAQNEQIRKNLNQATVQTLNVLYESDARNYAGTQLSITNATGETVEKLNQLYTQTSGDFSNLTEKQLYNLQKKLIPGWNGGIQTAIENTQKANNGINGALHKTFTQLSNNLGEKGLIGDLKDLDSAAGTNLGTPDNNSGIWKKLDDINTKSGDVKNSNESIIKLWNDNISTITGFSTELGKLSKEYEGITKNAKDAASAAYEFLTAQNKTASAETNSGQIDNPGLPKTPETKWQPQNYTNPERPVTTPDTTVTGTGSGGGTGNGGGGGITSSHIPKTIYVPINAEQHAVYVDGVFQKNESHDWRSDANSGNGAINGTTRRICIKCNAIHIMQLKDGALYKQHYENIPGYATGAYTGNWVGNDGKLGILHKKELILNQKDTSNMLKAVNITRSIDDSLSALKGNFTVPQILRNFAGGNTMNTSNLDQTVHITANFPSVNSKLEIEEAFSNLINRASQYAGRRAM